MSHPLNISLKEDVSVMFWGGNHHSIVIIGPFWVRATHYFYFTVTLFMRLIKLLKEFGSPFTPQYFPSFCAQNLEQGREIL